MNYQSIVNYLTENTYQVQLTDEYLNVILAVGIHRIKLTHYLLKNNYLTGMPIFIIENPRLLGELAHIGISCDDRGVEYGYFCVNTPDSVSINFEMPEVVFKETLDRYKKRFEELLLNEEFNHEEKIREFQASWWHLINKTEVPILSTTKDGSYEFIDILKPVDKQKTGFGSYYLAQSKNTEINEYINFLSRYARVSNRKPFKGFILPLSTITPAPTSQTDLPKWYVESINKISASDITRFNLDKLLNKAYEFWIIFNAPTPSGITWFAVHLQNRQRKAILPTSLDDIDKWQIKAVPLVVLNKELLLPRSGGNTSLCDKRVLLVGAGSVGGEIAEKLGKSGIGGLDIIDPDIFSMDNLYRHTLNMYSLNQSKSQALALEVCIRNPWLQVNACQDYLLNIDSSILVDSKYDLIILAIGSPTHERLFFKKLKNSSINIPIINTWVEGFGVGGHAVLSIPNQQGCLYCAYIDIPNRKHGLNSNLNFLQPNQDLTVNHGGCGSAFLPYSGLAASQTAIMASDLATKFLLGEVKDSTKISWKGSKITALAHNLELTDRYNLFEQSLQFLPLHNIYCDICHE